MFLFGCLFAAGAVIAADSAYIQKLRKQYSSRITFQTPYARQTIENFDLDCRSRDGRYLPLMNVFLAKLEALDQKEGWLTIYVANLGSEVRVYDKLIQADGKEIHSAVAFEIDRWGEIRSPNGKLEALMNACFGSYGPIWRQP